VEPPKVEMAKFTPPKIVKDEEVKKEDEVKEVEKLEDVKIGAIDQKGIKDDGLVAPTETVAPPAEEETDKIFTVVQIPAEFPGGTQGWIRYLERTLNRDLPVENGAPAGKYSVVVSFVVARDGSISDVKSENDPGYGTKDEAVRVITRGPKWKPAVQNGRNVIYRHRQAIVFVVSED
jgi:protein TonB